MKTPKTLKELNVKPGDVVEYVPTGVTSVVTKIECGKFYGDGENPENPYVDGAAFRIVSRASEKPKLWRDMTDAEKGALLLAAHDGKDIEFCRPDCIAWWRNANNPPEWCDGNAYRVKPEPKVETVEFTDNHISFAAIKGHRITFNTIDGKPDCNSIKMEEVR